MDKRYQVFISSTFTDLREERKEVIQKLLNAKYIPAGMEMFTAANDEQFSYIKKIIDTCDYYVLIVGARYGSINPSTGKSFTEQEYDYAVEKGIPVLAFVHDDPYNLPAEKRDDDKRKELESFRAKVMNGRLCQLWHTPVDLISSVIISLGEEVANNPQLGWTRGMVQDASDLLLQLNNLRLEKENLLKTVGELKNQLTTQTQQKTNLACGEDLYLVKGSKCSEDDYFSTYPVEYEISWDDIFSCVGPYLFSYVDYNTFLEKLLDGINSKFASVSFSYLNDDCVQTIKIQLQALELVEIVSHKSNKGGVEEFITLSEKGKKYISDVKAIRK